MLEYIYDETHPDECRLDLYLPEGGLPCPALIYFHGGSLEGGSRRLGEIDAVGKLVQDGIAVISVDYRVYPQAKFPDYLHDAAKAAAWAMHYSDNGENFSEVYLGGASAGAFISMMLCFDGQYLGEHGLNSADFAGFIFDAGQPTVHFNVLRERQLDSRLVRIDETAPLYHIGTGAAWEKLTHECNSRFLIMCADDDIPGRFEQLQLLIKTMEVFGCDPARITFRYLKGYQHCNYIWECNELGEYPYHKILRSFILDGGR